MNPHTFLTFSLVTLTQTLSVGPAVSLLLVNYLNSGFKKTLPVSFAFRAGEAVSLLIAFLITTLLHSSVVLFTVLKITGGLYLTYLGVKGFSTFLKDRNSRLTYSNKRTTGLFYAFLVPIINPKALIYFSSFIPSFIVNGSEISYGFQFLMFSCTFLIISLFSDMCFLVVAANAKKLIGDKFTSILTLTSSTFILLTGIVFIYKGAL